MTSFVGVMSATRECESLEWSAGPRGSGAISRIVEGFLGLGVVSPFGRSEGSREEVEEGSGYRPSMRMMSTEASRRTLPREW